MLNRRVPLKIPCGDRQHRLVCAMLPNPPKIGTAAGGSERRRRIRFEIRLPLLYKVLHRGSGYTTGLGQIVNISSRGAIFATSSALASGIDVELSIDWPASLDGRIPLRLSVTGKIVRSDSAFAAVAFKHYYFRIAMRRSA